ncbi:MAG: hypothetical protein WCK02_11805 [Bacteroidota bacterium]
MSKGDTQLILYQFNKGAELVFWAALHDYKPQVSNDPYKYSGLFSYDLNIKPAGIKYQNQNISSNN